MIKGVFKVVLISTLIMGNMSSFAKTIPHKDVLESEEFLNMKATILKAELKGFVDNKFIAEVYLDLDEYYVDPEIAFIKMEIEKKDRLDWFEKVVGKKSPKIRTMKEWKDLLNVDVDKFAIQPSLFFRLNQKQKLSQLKDTAYKNISHMDMRQVFERMEDSVLDSRDFYRREAMLCGVGCLFDPEKKETRGYFQVDIDKNFDRIDVSMETDEFNNTDMNRFLRKILTNKSKTECIIKEWEDKFEIDKDDIFSWYSLPVSGKVNFK